MEVRTSYGPLHPREITLWEFPQLQISLENACPPAFTYVKAHVESSTHWINVKLFGIITYYLAGIPPPHREVMMQEQVYVVRVIANTRSELRSIGDKSKLLYLDVYIRSHPLLHTYLPLAITEISSLSSTIEYLHVESKEKVWVLHGNAETDEENARYLLVRGMFDVSSARAHSGSIAVAAGRRSEPSVKCMDRDVWDLVSIAYTNIIDHLDDITKVGELYPLLYVKEMQSDGYTYVVRFVIDPALSFYDVTLYVCEAVSMIKCTAITRVLAFEDPVQIPAPPDN